MNCPTCGRPHESCQCTAVKPGMFRTWGELADTVLLAAAFNFCVLAVLCGVAVLVSLIWARWA